MDNKNVQSDTELQAKIYTLHQNLQKWAKKLPLIVQQRMSCELLANIARHLLNDPTIYEIVNSLLDIQHIVEEELYRERVELYKKQKMEVGQLKGLNLPRDLYKKQKAVMKKRHVSEMREFDIGVIMKLDQKVTEQQMVLEAVGLPSFRVTNNPIEIQVQMSVLEFILKSGKIAKKKYCNTPGTPETPESTDISDSETETESDDVHSPDSETESDSEPENY